MATHYETLGVKPGASSTEIRKAYLRRARALHPDRQMGRNEADSRLAEQAMQQVNVAWNVLSDTAKKSEYDAHLRPSTPRKVQARPTRPVAAPRSRPLSGQASQASRRSSVTSDKPRERAVDEEPGDGSVSVWASVPVLLIVGLLLGILVVTALASDDPPDNRPVTPGLATTLDVGDCFALVGDTPRERSCAAGQADGQVTNIAPTPGNCPAETSPIADPSSELYLCWVRLISGSIVTVAP